MDVRAVTLPLQRLLGAFALLVAMVLLAVPAQAQQATPAAFTPPAASATRPDLAPSPDSGFQRALEACIDKLRLGPAVAARHLGVSLVDITDTAHPRLAQVNGDHMFYAASLPKIAILLGAFEKAAAGKLALDEANQAELEAMIRRSSNRAATTMLNRVGMDFLAGVLQSDRYRLYDPKRNGGLWVGKPYGAGAYGQRDPLHGLSHGATAFQVSRFYYLMETGQLVSPEASQRMKAIMGSPAIRHKFVAGLLETHPDAAMYRKSGTWRNFHADSAIVEHDGRKYIAVGLSDDARGGDWLKNLIVGLDGIVFGGGTQAAF